MKINDYLPNFDFFEKHEILITANVEKVYGKLRTLTFSRSKMIRMLFWLRGLKDISFKNFYSDFVVLINDPFHEIAFGLVARPWKLKGEFLAVSKEEFLNFNKPGYAKIVWNFTFQSVENKTLVKTETRIFCTDKWSQWKFRVYWFFIRPFSGLVRIEMLRLLKLDSETAS